MPNNSEPIFDRPIRILSVDDSPADQALINYMLGRASIKNVVTFVSNGEEALRYLRHLEERGEALRPDLILLDLNLPGRGGYEILRELKGDPHLASIPVLVLTTSENPADHQKCHDLGVPCIVKPWDLDLYHTILNAITGLTGRALAPSV